MSTALREARSPVQKEMIPLEAYPGALSLLIEGLPAGCEFDRHVLDVARLHFVERVLSKAEPENADELIWGRAMAVTAGG